MQYGELNIPVLIVLGTHLIMERHYIYVYTAYI